MLQYCPQYPLEIYEKSIPEYGISQGIFRDSKEWMQVVRGFPLSRE